MSNSEGESCKADNNDEVGERAVKETVREVIVAGVVGSGHGSVDRRRKNRWTRR